MTDFSLFDRLRAAVRREPPTNAAAERLVEALTAGVNWSELQCRARFGERRELVQWMPKRP